MRKAIQAFLILLLVSTATFAQKNPKAEDILRAAKARATEQNKAIFLIFGASWCEACHQLDTFLALPDVSAILNKYFVISELTFGEGSAGHPEWDTPGADELMLRYGGVSSSGTVGLPFIALVDAKAKLIANSIQPGKGKAPGAETGFPTEPGEIQWFLSILQKAAPNLTEEELRKIQSGLQKAASSD